MSFTHEVEGAISEIPELLSTSTRPVVRSGIRRKKKRFKGLEVFDPEAASDDLFEGGSPSASGEEAATDRVEKPLDYRDRTSSWVRAVPADGDEDGIYYFDEIGGHVSL